MKTKTRCSIGLTLFAISYIMFANNFAFAKTPIDFAHWINLTAAVFLISFNRVFPKNWINTIAGFLLTLGVIAHIGLCTIDIIMWSFGTDEASRIALSEHLNIIPSIVYPFVIIGPSLLFVGLATHAINFVKTHTIHYLMVLFGSMGTGYSFFILKNGLYMVLSCLVFVSGLALLLYQEGHNSPSNSKIK